MAKKMGGKAAEISAADYLKNLEHPLKKVLQALRKVVMATDREIGEQVKWNSLSFYFTGEMKPFDPKEYKRDILVCNLHKKDHILLVFPTGASISDKTGLLEGNFPDTRKVAKISSLDEVKKKEKHLQQVLKTWLSWVKQ